MNHISLGLSGACFCSVPAIRPVIDQLQVLSASDTGAQVSITASPEGATAYLYLSQSAVAPSATDLIAGTGADWSGSLLVTNLPSGTPGPSGLTPGTAYHLHAIVDGAGGRSTIVSVGFTTAAADTVAPVLSAGQATVLNASQVDLSISTDEANGTLYAVVTTTQGVPSVAQFGLGQDSTGAAAAFANSGQAVSEAGEQMLSATELSETTHYAYVMHEDASGNMSSIFEIGPFTPSDVTAAVVSSVEIVADGTEAATVTFNTDTGEGTAHVAVLMSTAPAPLASEIVAGSHGGVSASIAISAGGPQSLSISGLASETAYLAYVVQVDAAGNLSDVETAPETATTGSLTTMARYLANGTDDLTARFKLSAAATGQADPDGGSNAVEFVNDGTGGGMQMTGAVTFNDGLNYISVRLKLTNVGGSIGLPVSFRLSSVSVTTSSLAEYNLSNGTTTTPGASIVDLGAGWYELVYSLDMSGDADRDGYFTITVNEVNTVAGDMRFVAYDAKVMTI